MQLHGVLYTGPRTVDQATLLEAPADLQTILRQVNGFVAFRGGFHLRGACTEPIWHSLAHVWKGPAALHKVYSSLAPTDVPFAQDCLGDQFFLRSRDVWKLLGETGEIQPLELDLGELLRKANENPVGFLTLQPLLQFLHDGNKLEPGQLLNVFPPLSTKESANGVTLKAVPVLEQLKFLGDFSRQLGRIPDGMTMSFKLIL